MIASGGTMGGGAMRFGRATAAGAGPPSLLGGAAGAGPAGHLPQRIRVRIAEQEAQGELLVGWMQLGLAACLGLLWAVSPSPPDAAAGRASPVPWIIGLYAGLTGLRLWLAGRRSLPGPVIVASIAVDVGLLLVLVWLFHGQYGEPPAFSLKVPTFVYLFVLVALRALRFDARYVLVAGAAAAAGWIGLTLLVVAASPAGTVTRDFRRYVLGNSVLLGAEIDKVLAIVATALVLAFVVHRAKRLLVTAVAEEAAGREVRRFLSRGVPEAITRSEHLRAPGEAVERSAAILFLDVRGFTALAGRLPPAAVVQVLTSLHERVVPEIRRHGGVVDKFLGDGIMATFGAVEPSPSAAADAMRALDGVLAAAALWREGMRDAGSAAEPAPALNASLAAGNVVAALLGDAERLELTVIGEAVNVAAKLEKLNKSLGSRALVTAAAHELALAQGYAAPEGNRWRAEVGLPGVTGGVAVVAIG